MPVAVVPRMIEDDAALRIDLGMVCTGLEMVYPVPGRSDGNRAEPDVESRSMSLAEALEMALPASLRQPV